MKLRVLPLLRISVGTLCTLDTRALHNKHHEFRLVFGRHTQPYYKQSNSRPWTLTGLSVHSARTS